MPREAALKKPAPAMVSNPIKRKIRGITKFPSAAASGSGDTDIKLVASTKSDEKEESMKDVTFENASVTEAYNNQNGLGGFYDNLNEFFFEQLGGKDEDAKILFDAVLSEMEITQCTSCKKMGHSA